MGYTEKMTNGRYKGTYRAPNGRERSKTFDRKLDADRWWQKGEADKARGDWADPRLARLAYEEWAEKWLGTIVHLKPKTVASYEGLLRTQILPAFGSVPLGRIDTLAVKAWVAAMLAAGLSPSRIRQAYRVFSATTKAAVEAGYLVKTPCVGVKLPRLPKTHVRFLEAAQVETLVAATDAPYRTLVYLLAYGGLRWGEACALRRRHCELLRSRLRIAESLAEVAGDTHQTCVRDGKLCGDGLHVGPTKTHAQRFVALPAFLVEMLASHLAGRPDDPDALVFVDAAGGPLRHSPFWYRVWDPARAALPGELAELKIHELRHTCAALLVARGAHAKAIQEHLGHSTITVTMDLYGHLFPDEKDRLAAALDDTWRVARENPAASSRPAEVVELAG
jgi:integrase